MKPGRRVASPRSMTRAPGGAAPVPTDTIRSPRTTTAAPSLSVVPVASNTCAALSTRVSAGAGASAESTGVSAPATKQLKPASIGVDQLVRGAEVRAVGGERALHGRLGEREHRGDLRPGLEELGSLAVDDLEVALFSRVRIVGVHQLQYFALGDDVGGVGHDLHDRLTAERGHHLEGARVDEVTDQHARRVAEHLVRGMPAAPER